MEEVRVLTLVSQRGPARPDKGVPAAPDTTLSRTLLVAVVVPVAPVVQAFRRRALTLAQSVAQAVWEFRMTSPGVQLFMVAVAVAVYTARVAPVVTVPLREPGARVVAGPVGLHLRRRRRRRRV